MGGKYSAGPIGVVGLVPEPDKDGNLAATFRGQRRPRILKLKGIAYGEYFPVQGYLL